MGSPRSLTREQLHELVWSKPTTQIAKEFGVSDVAVAKACKRYEVPKPPLGYWAKVQNGQKPKLVPLPKPTKENLPATIVFAGQRKAPPLALTQEALAAIETENDPAQRIVVPDSLRGSHKLVQRTREAFLAPKADDYGRGHARFDGCLNVSVSKDSLPRALKIMDALIKALETRGHQVEVTEVKNHWDYAAERRTEAVIHGERIRFKIEEPSKRRLNDAPEPKESWRYREKYLYSASGRLRLIIENWLGDGFRRLWSDGEKQRIEDCLNDFVAHLLKAAEKLKLDRIEAEKRRIAEEERRRRAEEMERQRQAELAKIQDLESKAARWESAERIRRFLDEVERSDSEGRHAEWIAWGRHHANKLDPIEKLGIQVNK